MIRPFGTNIERDTLKNKYYRKVLFTGDEIQLVVMSLKVGEDIPFEIHPQTDQFIRVEKGNALIIVDGKRFQLKDGGVVVVPRGLKHYVKNTSRKYDLKLYTIYSPPNHPIGTLHERQADAEAAE